MSRKKKARERYPLILLTLASLLFLSLRCKDFGEPPPEGSVRLSPDYVSCTEVWLKLAFADNNDPRGFVLLRDGAQFASGLLTKSDTLLVDTTVVAGHDYSYTAQRLNGSYAFDATTLDVRTLDSTSHAINWIVDTLGAQGVVRDVWVFDRNNAWAVGEMYQRDSIGQLIYPPCNVARWDGYKWTLYRFMYDSKLLYPGSGGSDSGYAEVRAIFAFNENDIWLASGTVQHYTGDKIVQYRAEGAGFASKIWGRANEFWFVGSQGFIVRYNGSSWTQMTSNTTVDLEDVYGLDATHIWATGTNVSDGHSVVLQYDGTKWTTIYDNANNPTNGIQYFNTVWTDNRNYLYLDGGSYIHILNLHNMTLGNEIKTGANYTASGIRGNAQNDIFEVTIGGEVAHFGGTSWHYYSTEQPLNNTDNWWTSIHPIKDMVIIGGWYYTGLNGVPIVVRGYR
jgi:hypothetical protein